MLPRFGWTRLSLLYPAIVLFAAGSGLLLKQDVIFTLMLSNGNYSPTVVQMAGMFMMVLSAFVWQTLRCGWAEMYLWTIWLRLFMAGCFVWFFQQTGDPFFLCILIVLTVGISLTLLGIRADRDTRKSVGYRLCDSVRDPFD